MTQRNNPGHREDVSNATTHLPKRLVSLDELLLKTQRENAKLPEGIRDVMDMYIAQVDRGIGQNDALFPQIVAQIIDGKFDGAANEDDYTIAA